MDKILPIGLANPALEVQRPGTAGAAAGGVDFSDALKQALDSVNEQAARADELQRKFQLEDPAVSLEETMIAMQTASLSLQALIQVRNRIVSAYQEIMNLHV